MFKRYYIFLCFFVLGTPLVVSAATSSVQDTLAEPSAEEEESNDYIFFNPDGIGAHAFYTPWAVIIESGFEEYGSKSLSKLNLARGQSNVLKAIREPTDTILRYGADNFLYQQLLPVAALTGGPPSYLPNYLWHLIGGGFRFRLMSEYFTHHGFEHPKLMSWLTLYAGHWINEAVQAQDFQGGSADALADLFVFDWLGKVLFLSTPVAEFFADFFHLRDWTFQTSYDPISNTLINTGQLYWARVDLLGGFSISSLTGHTVNAFNLTYTPDGDATQYSLGLGLQANRFTVLENDDLTPAGFRWCFLATYSENDNPIVVVVGKEGLPGNTLYETTATGEEVLRRDNYSLAPSLQINVYPKWFELFEQKLAMHVTWEQEAIFIGFGHGALPLGLSLSTPRKEKYRDDF